jgi:hypothetical protein
MQGAGYGALRAIGPRYGLLVIALCVACVSDTERHRQPLNVAEPVGQRTCKTPPSRARTATPSDHLGELPGVTSEICEARRRKWSGVSRTFRASRRC